jgi:hypothetical protein
MTRFFEYESDFTPSRESLLREVGKLADFLDLASARYDYQLNSVVTV